MSRILPPYIYVNGGFGIPTLSSNSVTVTTTNVAFDFYNHRNIGRPFRGLLIVRLAQAIPTGTTGTLPIVFTSDGGNSTPVTTFNGDPITVGDIPGTGVYILWYESQTDTLQLLTGSLV
jgi:hypothetical protein